MSSWGGVRCVTRLLIKVLRRVWAKAVEVTVRIKRQMGLRITRNLCFESSDSILIWSGVGHSRWLFFFFPLKTGTRRIESGRKWVNWIWEHVQLEVTVGQTGTEISGENVGEDELSIGSIGTLEPSEPGPSGFRASPLGPLPWPRPWAPRRPHLQTCN